MAALMLISAAVALSQARFPFKRNRLRALRKRKPQGTQALTANHGCHCFDRAFVLAGACVCCVNCQCKRLRFLRFSFTQRTQRKRLRLNGNPASDTNANQSYRSAETGPMCRMECLFSSQLALVPKYGEQRHVCVNNGRDSNLRPVGCKSKALTTTPPRHIIQRKLLM